MLGPDARGPGSPGAEPPANGQRHRLLTRSPNGHLHLAILAALAAATLVAFAIPISRTQASDSRPGRTDPVETSRHAVSRAVRSQAETVTELLAPSLAAGRAQNAEATPPSGTSPISQSLFVAAAARLAAKGALQSGEAEAALVITRPHTVSFTLHENGFVSVQASAQLTVGQALADLGIRLGAADLVSPRPGSEIMPGQHVYVQYASTVRLNVGGQQREMVTHATNVGGLLAEAGLRLEPMDRIYPPADRPVYNGLTVSLTTIRDVDEVHDVAIEHDVTYVYDDELPQGESLLVEAGTDGYLRRQYRSHQVNGKTIFSDLVSETLVLPSNAVVALGTYVPLTPTPEPPRPAPVFAAPADPGGELDCSRTLRVWATWYTAASAGGGGTTATGTGVYKGIVAVDPSVIPLGTQMYIPGYGFGLAADTGGGIIGNMIDLGYGPYDVYDWRTQWVDICIF